LCTAPSLQCETTGTSATAKVFISALWMMMLRLDVETGCNLTNGATIEDFKAWLLRSRRLTRDGSAWILAGVNLQVRSDPRLVRSADMSGSEPDVNEAKVTTKLTWYRFAPVRSKPGSLRKPATRSRTSDGRRRRVGSARPGAKKLDRLRSPGRIDA
jgi:hypothetical protein